MHSVSHVTSLACELEPACAVELHGSSRLEISFKGKSRYPRSLFVTLIGEKLAGHFDFDSIPGRMWLALDLHIEVNGAHDPVSELFVD